MPQLVRLHGDYFIEPIFLGAEDFDDTDYVNASDMPLSPELIQDIDAWQQELDDSIDMRIGQSQLSDQEWNALQSRGLDLARRLQSELGSQYEVYYGQVRAFACVPEGRSGDLSHPVFVKSGS